MATKYASWETLPRTGALTVDDVDWQAQTFSPDTTHTLTSVKIHGHRSSTSIGTVTVSIRAVDANHKPTGADLSIGTFDGDTMPLTGSPDWSEAISMTAYVLTASTEYALVVRKLALAGTLNWSYESSGYAGVTWYSGDSGVSWDATAQDALFQEWGVLAPEDKGTLWQETTKLHIIDESGDEQSFEGALVAAGSNPEGTLWMELTKFHNIDVDGDERSQQGTATGDTSDPGYIHIEGAHLHGIDESGDERYL